MKFEIDHNTSAVQKAIDRSARQVPFAMSVALNKTAAEAKDAVRAEMQSVFDRPTPWVLNSLRIKYATKVNLVAELAFKDKPGSVDSRSMLEPQVFAGGRRLKRVEHQLTAAGLMPAGYNVVPGAGATLDSYGNMVASQVGQLLRFVATHGPVDHVRAKNAARLARGSKTERGFKYFAVPVGARNRLSPGVYKRFTAGAGSHVLPILMFVRPSKYTQRLGFFEVVEKKMKERLPQNFSDAFEMAVRTSFERRSSS